MSDYFSRGKNNNNKIEYKHLAIIKKIKHPKINLFRNK